MRVEETIPSPRVASDLAAGHAERMRATEHLDVRAVRRLRNARLAVRKNPGLRRTLVALSFAVVVGVVLSNCANALARTTADANYPRASWERRLVASSPARARSLPATRTSTRSRRARFPRRHVATAPRSVFAAMRPGTGPTRDRVLQPPAARALAARVRAAQQEEIGFTYSDARGREFYVWTHEGEAPLEALDHVAALVKALPHGWELKKLSVLVVDSVDMPAYCDSDAAQACYQPRDPDRSFEGTMIVAWDDPELPHTVAHEYGHHLDNARLNIAHLPLLECPDYSADGSRRWFFARQLADDILRVGFNCRNDSSWETLLPELYAEDFAVLAGSNGWGRIASVPPPSLEVLDDLREDIVDPFVPESSRFRGRLARRGARRAHRFRVRWPTFLYVEVSGPRRAEIDLVVYESGKRRPLSRTRQRGSKDSTVVELFQPGTYRVEVRARRAGGRYRLLVGKL